MEVAVVVVAVVTVAAVTVLEVMVLEVTGSAASLPESLFLLLWGSDIASADAWSNCLFGTEKARLEHVGME